MTGMVHTEYLHCWQETIGQDILSLLFTTYAISNVFENICSKPICFCFNILSQYKRALLILLEDTARYAGLLLAAAEGFGGGLFFALRQEKLIAAFRPILGHFWCSVTSVTQ